MGNRFDYIGFANGGKEVGPQPPGVMDRVASGAGELALRTAAIPYYAISDVANTTTRHLANAGNWVLGKLTGYEVPYEVDLPERQSEENLRQAGQIVGDAMAGMGVRRLPQAPAKSAIPPPAAKPANKTSPSNNPTSNPRKPEGQMTNDVWSGSSVAIPPPALTPVGSFQVAGGPKRTFSADASGSWYEGGKRMGGIMGAPGRVGSGNPAVDDIVSRLLSNRSGYGGGAALPGDEIAGSAYREQVEHAMRVNAANGFAPTPEQMRITGMSQAGLANLLAANNKGGRYDDLLRSIVQNEAISTTREKIDLDRAMLPVEMKQRLAMADMYQGHGDYYRAMSDPQLQLQLKGKDAQTEMLKANNEILKTILPKAYDSADAQTKAYLEANPNADRNAVWNSAFNNALSAYTDQYSRGMRYAPGVQMPGNSSWFGFNAPEVNIPGGWGDPAMNNLYNVTAQALQAVGNDGLKRTEIMNRFNDKVKELRGRS